MISPAAVAANQDFAGGITDDRILDSILLHEGWPRYTNNPNDRGGPTKGGITLATLNHWRGVPTSTDDLRRLGEDEARLIYSRRYIEGERFHLITDPLLRWHVVDCGVLHGPARAARWLQQAAGGDLVADGVIGPRSLKAINGGDAHRIAVRLGCIRIRFLGELINDNAKARRRGETTRDQATFAEGWMVRATSFLDLEAARQTQEV
ncbi:MAG TPA: glycosyl hydrolase 108 family protein [Thermoanaerobaculia bacterium]|nr:glycosyl hydrolase 108 family protein [Thermoanaerobaculia bacterium]